MLSLCFCGGEGDVSDRVLLVFDPTYQPTSYNLPHSWPPPFLTLFDPNPTSISHQLIPLQSRFSPFVPSPLENSLFRTRLPPSWARGKRWEKVLGYGLVIIIK